MKHTLQLRLSQHLTLTPQLQQSIRLLQLSTLELNQELERFLQENPLLEREDDGEAETPNPEEASFAPPDFANAERPAREEPEAPNVPETPEYDAEARADRDWMEDDGGSYGSRDDGEEPEYPQLPAVSSSLREHLLWQLNVTNLPDRDKRIVAMLIDMLDDDGYLGGNLEELAETLPVELEIDIEELQIALKHLQNMEPAGIGARSLGESLVLQLEALPAQTPLRKEAIHTA
nr:RNA polymerase factor sigma-54 [Burkholderiales bacterium]